MIFVINLASEVGRWKRISTALEQAGFEFVRIRAIDARRRGKWITARLRGKKYSTAMRRNLTSGECACILSHIAALKRIVREGLPYAIVMEDDAVMDHRFVEFVQDDLATYLVKCAVVKIEGIEGAPRRGVIIERATASSLILPFVPTQGSAAYAVTHAGASHLIKRFQSFSDPLDFMLSFYEWLGCTYGEVRPLLVQQENWQDNRPDSQPSTLHAEREVAYSGTAVARNPISRATDLIVHEIFRRGWRIAVMVGWAVRFRTFLISVR